MPKKETASSEINFVLCGIVFITFGIFSFFSLIGFSTGIVGAFIIKLIRYSFGIGSILIPIFSLYVGSIYLTKRRALYPSRREIALFAFFIFLLAVFHHFRVPIGEEIIPANLPENGGITGGILLFFLRKIFGKDGSLIILAALMLSSSLFVFFHSFIRIVDNIKLKASEQIAVANDYMAATRNNTLESIENSLRFYDQEKDNTIATLPIANKEIPEPIELPLLVEPSIENLQYKFPPTTLLYTQQHNTKSNRPTKETADNARIIEETLENFGVNAKIIHTSQGPAVTRYELEPAAGVKVNKIVNLADDLALKLASSGIRIEAPIPGKAAIGIEVPNRIIDSVFLRDVIESEEFKKNTGHLSVALGKNITGNTVVADLSKMPHLLVAGATGSGKSVCINSILISILYTATPAEVKFVLIDPKVVELSNYNGIPHLLTPVVTDAKKAASALNWAVQEMEKRYELFAKQGVREILRYNQVTQQEKLPFIVVVIDELADLMMVAPVDVEDAICRLAQKARAAGIHLVLATQRPSVDVITGTIKANIPSRISFAVSSQVDSRTILDMAGAEKLLGRGDMLYYPVGSAKPIRVQGAYIGENEIDKVVAFIKQQEEPEYLTEITAHEPIGTKTTENNNNTMQDELLEDAVRIILETGQASVSMLQRKFRIGYTRAARIIDTLEEMKIIGPNVGSKPRDILMTSEQLYARYFKKQ